MAEKKSRILVLLEYLNKNTDDEHSVTTQDLIDVLAAEGFTVERHTLKNYMKQIMAAGFDVHEDKKGKYNAYHMGARQFELPELKMLIDAVSSSRFISPAKSEELIQKLTEMTSEYQSEALTAKIYAADRIKTDNGKIFLISDIIRQAVDQGKKIEFQYYDYTPDKKKVLRHDGETYVNSPYALIWNDDRYYLVGYSEKREKVIPFRVDRMTIPNILEEDAILDPDFNTADYCRKVIKMYSGPEKVVTLCCENELMKNVVDKFGEDIHTWQEEDDPEHFCAEVEVQTGKTFFGWVFQFGGAIRITGPEDVRKEYLKMARKVVRLR